MRTSARHALRRRKLLLGALSAAPIALLMSARASDLLARRQRLLEAGDRRAANLAVVLSGYLGQTLSAADAALRQLAIHSRRIDGASAPASEWLDILRTAKAGLAGVGSISVVDSTGIIRHSTQPPIVGQSRRDSYVFRILSAGGADVLVADPPFRTMFSPGRPMLLPVARRLTSARGSFAGIVVATFLPDSLRHLFQIVDVGSEGEVAVMHLEGIVLLQEPSVTDPIGDNVAETPLFRAARASDSGRFRGVARQSGAIHRTAYRTAPTLPFIIAVSLSERELLSSWRGDVALSAAVFGFIALGASVLLVVLFRQMDDRAVAETSLAASEERFRLLATATNDAVWDWDLATNRLWWNDGFAVLLGALPETPPSIESWMSHVHPVDRDRVVTDLNRAIDGTDTSWSTEYRFLRGGGGHAYVQDHRHIIRDAEGRATRVITGMVDRTERRLAEERLREQATLLDSATDAILLHDLAHRIRYWNRGAERLYGWSAQEVVGKSVEAVLYRESEQFRAATKAVMESGSWSGELVQVARDDKRSLVEGRWTLLRTPEGEPSSILTINTDITERRKLEQQFLRAQRMESIGTLAGGIAHDLNNVLAPILLSIGLLRDEETNPASLELLAMIEVSAQRGADMVRQVLTFARGMGGNRQEVDVRDLLRDIAKIAHETFLKHIEVRTVTSPDLWPVTGDVTQLHQVLLNLSVNARDAMPGGGRLTLSARNTTIDEHQARLEPHAAQGPYVQIQVEDTGTGIPPGDLERIFDPFFTTKELGKGTGLGLSTTLAIVKSHGGFLRVYSEAGQGTTFRVYLPATGTSMTGEFRADDVTSALPRGNGELVLVVDDESAVREVVRQTLEAFGYQVLLAADGAEATSLFATRKSDIAVVLTDMMMPIMDGPTTIQVLRRLDGRVRIIAASGLSEKGDMPQVAKAGVRHFLQKPYTAESLLTTMRQILAEDAPNV